MQLDFVPEAESVLGCVEEYAVEVWLRNSSPPTPVAGYQVFLRFPAESFQLLRFEPLALDTSVYVAGPEPFGNGYAPCPDHDQDADPWDDGQGDDVAAVAATVLASATGEPSAAPFTDGEVLLGRFVFRPTGVAADSGEAVFSSNTEPCDRLLNQTTRVFGESGNSLPVSVGEAFGVDVLSGVAAKNLTCTQPQPGVVDLRWELPDIPVDDLEGWRVYRNGKLIATLPSNTAFRDEDLGDLKTITYEVIPLLRGGFEGCRTRCELFRRGDANSDGGVNITDAVTILGFLFRGTRVSCVDANDADDTGGVNVTDAIYLLNFLFLRGPSPEPPFPDLGTDPTPDDLGCSG